LQIENRKPRLTLPPSARLAGRSAFAAVFAGKTKVSRGPFSLYATPNNLPHSRFGTSIGRPSGNAVVRNTIKRRIREAYRHLRPTLPGQYDMVLVIRPHQPQTKDQYQSLLLALHQKLHALLHPHA
jgi:ribonuclease P protein component